MSRISITGVEEEGNQMSFKLKGVPVPFANALRRVAIGQLPVYAIDEVTVYENNTAFFDEFIANRIGLIPITTPDKFDEEVMFSLNVEGPMLVTSASLESSSPKVDCANKKIPIIELGNKQVLRLEGTARKGIGRRHAKFQAGIASYSYDEEGEYEFVVESFGQMSPRDIVKRSLSLLIEKCKEIEKEL
ncbi:MAG: DNA-directed RNA polymerase subunit D [Candidatus Micrarchaeota archaeon]|nr:DNA-directed RNA polymerase subunit D [Candidatus Micrarchaeota archaeon]